MELRRAHHDGFYCVVAGDPEAAHGNADRPFDHLSLSRIAKHDRESLIPIVNRESLDAVTQSRIEIAEMGRGSEISTRRAERDAVDAEPAKSLTSRDSIMGTALLPDTALSPARLESRATQCDVPHACRHRHDTPLPGGHRALRIAPRRDALVRATSATRRHRHDDRVGHPHRAERCDTAACPPVRAPVAAPATAARRSARQRMFRLASAPPWARPAPGVGPIAHDPRASASFCHCPN